MLLVTGALTFLALVVLAGILFWVVPAYIAPTPVSCAGCPPDYIGMEETGGSTPQAGLFYPNLTLHPTLGVTTALFSLELVRSNRSIVDVGSAPTSCRPGSGSTPVRFGPDTCSAPSGNWYAVLVSSSSTVLAVFDVPGSWSGSGTPLNATQSIDLVSSADYQGSSAVLNVFGTDSVSVSGSVAL